MSGHSDVAIVGGGIAGSALATVLARAGLDVLVLERQATYKDRIRGEWFAPWGVAETQRLGLYDVLREAGGHHLTRHIGYGEAIAPEQAEASPLAFDGMLPDVPGPLCLTHVAANQALADAAVAAGAEFVRGVSSVDTTLGPEPEVSWDGRTRRCRIVIGADGRVSQVRAAAGIRLDVVQPRNHLAGLLVDGLDWWPSDAQTLGAERDVLFAVFPQGKGRVRLYIGVANERRGEFGGAHGPRNFLNEFRLQCVPGGERFADAIVAGPCAAYAGDDTWTDRPFAPGVVLIGDAAGYSDPSIGQGLSLAMRDVRLVSEALLGERDWSSSIFTDYAVERTERMRRMRLCAEVLGSFSSLFGAGAYERRLRNRETVNSDPVLFSVVAAAFVGPELLPREAFDEQQARAKLV